MAYQALYRQWRPKDFSSMVAQEAVISTLRNQVMSGRVAHAYLFCGSRGTGKTIYILDEPTTGLHTDDVAKLLVVLNRLCENGNTVLVIEHNLDVIKTADHIIDLGPEGGDGGGTVVVTGTPEEVAACERSYTGQYLKRIL